MTKRAWNKSGEISHAVVMSACTFTFVFLDVGVIVNVHLLIGVHRDAHLADVCVDFAIFEPAKNETIAIQRMECLKCFKACIQQ